MMSHLIPWPFEPNTSILGSNDVHVWCASLDLKPSQLESLYETLAEDERARARRYHAQKDRDHFIVARGRLREILSRYLKISANKIHFCYGAYGKPALASSTDRQPLHFNISHSHGMALYAISLDREVGIDLERVRPGVMKENIAQLFFSPYEVEKLRSLPDDLQQKAFFNCWSRKEAYIKARGEGLHIKPDSFDVSLCPGEPPTLLRSSAGPDESSRWSLYDLNPGKDYAAAIAVEGHDIRIKCWQWGETPTG